jgi:cupin superfamily acireductone dioxygenase involved in methionine salvage
MRAQSWVRYKKATTISILIEGSFQIHLRANGETRDILLEKQGDYVTMPPGVDHNWTAITDCVVMSVRFPSLPDDQLKTS